MTNAPDYSGIAILIARVGANAGSKYLVDGNYSVTDNTLILRLKSGNDYDFFSNLLEYKKLNKLTFGSGQPLVTGGLLKQIEIKSPDPVEQTKIANFLTAVDDKISQLTKKHELLTLYKKGVMQKIFSQELRFKDDEGREFPEWEEKKLGEISTFFSGGTPLTTNRKFYQGNIPFIKSGEINSLHTDQFITEEALEKSSAKLVKPGDILYALYGATSGEVAIGKIGGAINQAVLCIRSELDHYFLYSYLFFRKESILKKYIQGGQGNLSADIIKSLDIFFPSIKEQTKIANFLAAIDDKITNVKSQLEVAKDYKQGLLQQMFI